MGKEIFTNDKYINDLFLKVVNLVTQARERVATAVNIAEVYTKFHIGQYIVEYEQKGETRAEYGKAVPFIIYFVLILLLGGLNESDLPDFPMGMRIGRLAKKLHLM